MLKQLIEAICFRLINGPLGGVQPPEFQIGRLDVKPGDIIVLRSADRLSDKQVERMQAHFRDAVGSDNKVMVLEGLDIAVLKQEAA